MFNVSAKIHVVCGDILRTDGQNSDILATIGHSMSISNNSTLILLYLIIIIFFLYIAVAN